MSTLASIAAAWERVAAECPLHRSAEEHRRGALVHVVPYGHNGDVRCLPAEPVGIYPGFYRPRGGYPHVHPTGTTLPTREDIERRGASMPAPLPVRKTFTYLAAEMAGRWVQEKGPDPT